MRIIFTLLGGLLFFGAAYILVNNYVGWLSSGDVLAGPPAFPAVPLAACMVPAVVCIVLGWVMRHR